MSVIYFEPLGSARSEPRRARLIASTNGNLEEMIEQGRFRADLYHRLSVVSLTPPALREQPEAIPPPQVNLRAVASLSERLSSGLPAMVESSLADQRWAYLDHDARLTMEMFARRFPFDLTSTPAKPGAASTP